MISLYIHIPFCSRKCDYCHFYVIPNKIEYRDQLLNALELEWQIIRDHIQDETICSIYFGGGTPSLFGPKAISQLIEMIDPPSKCEITLEANPENVGAIQEYAAIGINRVSLGVQSFHNHYLKILTRTHDAQQAIQAVYQIKKVIDNISIDLMYDLPGQTLHDWQSTLDQAVTLPITHLSLYNLTIEPHTVFYKYRERIKQPSEEISAEMYKRAINVLGKHFQQYEISAFCKPGKQSVHNVGYWTGRSFLGLGPSAFSYWSGCRYRNVANLSRYHRLLKQGKLPIDFREKLSLEASLRERFAIHLRLLEGVNMQTFPSLSKETIASLEKLQEQDFVIRQEGHLKLTERGMLFYDTVAAELI